MAFATGPVVLFLAQVAGLLHGLLKPATNSYVVKLVHINETGKAFALLGLATNVSTLIGGIVDNRLYNATVDWYAPTTYLVTTAGLLLNTVMLLFVHVFSIRGKIET